jgi:hypothetical protein
VPPPTDAQIRAALDAMRVDAAMWTQMSDELRTAAGIAATLQLSALHFSYLADKAGLTSTYQQIQAAMVRLMGEGAGALEGLAGALRTAADGYEEDERRAVHRTRDIY